MNYPPGPPPPPPTSSAPTVLGILSLVFGILGVLCSCYSGFNGIMMPAMAKIMETAQAQVEADRARREQDFADRLAAASTDAERSTIEAERDAWRRTNPPINLAEMYAWSREPKVFVPMIVGPFLMLILNALLIAAGAGLLGRREWARKLAIGTAAGKIAVSLAFSAVMGFIVVPAIADSMGRMIETMQNQMPTGSRPPIPIETIANFYKVFGGAGVVVGAIVSCVFPMILIIVLRLENVRRAFPSGPRPA